jgi:hypothetical protein
LTFCRSGNLLALDQILFMIVDGYMPYSSRGIAFSGLIVHMYSPMISVPVHDRLEPTPSSSVSSFAISVYDI